MDFRELLVQSSQKAEAAILDLKNVTSAEILVLGLSGLAVFLVIFIFAIIVRAFKKDPIQEYDIFKDPVYEPMVAKFDNLEKLLKGIQQDRIQYQNKVTTQLHELRDKVIRIQGIIGYEDFQINSATSQNILNPNSNPEPSIALSQRDQLKFDNRLTQEIAEQKVKETTQYSSQTSEMYREEITLSDVSEDDLKKKSKNLSENLSQGLSKTRVGFFQKLKQILSGRPKIAETDLDELQALLVGADLGVKLSEQFLNRLKLEVSSSEIQEQEFINRLKAYVLEVFGESSAKLETGRRADGPSVYICVGVNGVGKTTSAAKLAARYKAAGKKVLLIAADTFRAAAVQQLIDWSKRIEVEIVTGPENAKPGSVVFDGLERAKSENFDLVIIDTAGRLHNKANLMQELEGIKNIIKKQQPSAPHEVLLVVDGATGQNALNQAREFQDVIELSGSIVTKLDGTPKGGIVIAIKQELGIPVRFIGVGEKVEDLRDFNAEEFIAAIFDQDPEDVMDNINELNEEEQAVRRRRRRE